MNEFQPSKEIVNGLTNTLQNTVESLDSTSSAASEFMNEINSGNFLVFEEKEKLLTINPKLNDLINNMDIITKLISKSTLKTIREYMTDCLLSRNLTLHKISNDYSDYSRPVYYPLFVYGSRLQPIDISNIPDLERGSNDLVYSIVGITPSQLFIDSDNEFVINGLPITIYVTNYAQLMTDSDGNPFRYVNYIDPKDNTVKTGIKFSVLVREGQMKNVIVAQGINLSIIKFAYVKQMWEPLKCWLIPRFNASN